MKKAMATRVRALNDKPAYRPPRLPENTRIAAARYTSPNTTPMSPIVKSSPLMAFVELFNPGIGGRPDEFDNVTWACNKPNPT
jgi:hypothetical protein